MTEGLGHFHFSQVRILWMFDDGVSRLRKFLGAEAKRGHLCNLNNALRPPNQSPPDLCQQLPACAYCTRNRKSHS